MMNRSANRSAGTRPISGALWSSSARSARFSISSPFERDRHLGDIVEQVLNQQVQRQHRQKRQEGAGHQSLMVLEEGVIEGRRTFANMLKYIKMTASSNFGNVCSSSTLSNGIATWETS
jgi:hypothetical protein